ncbi:ribonuclease T2-like [Amia ocellicauda]|uniref:ribonuclease T2-like n=1 Tax=Amia ocellicauda TaxID=2972642 RepID=UPI003463DB21
MSLFSSLSLALLLVHALPAATQDSHTGADKTTCQWECMKFTLLWPGSFCVSLKVQCMIPEYVKSWTIHGLWPMSIGHCCSCWPIFPSDLEELQPQLSQVWPTLLKSKSNFTFWKEEWIKHGTCAACVEGMNSPTKYFQTSLKLEAHYNIQSVLKGAGIEPSCNMSYKYEQLHSALAPVLGDLHFIQCVEDHRNRQVWVQVKIPMFKNFTLGCHRHLLGTHQHPPHPHPSPGHPCPQQTPIYLFPISYDNPHQPCD